MSMKYICATAFSVLMLGACSNQKNTANPPLVLNDAIKSKKYDTSQLYQVNGQDRTWQQVLQSDDLKPLATFTRKGSLGAKVDVNNEIIETGPYADNPINAAERRMRLHGLGNPSIGHAEFSNWSRWYQEDGNTQIFRLFEGEVNTSNKRANAARIETFIPDQTWLPAPGVVREFGARFTIVKSAGCVAPHYCSIFQAKGNNVDHWSVMLRVDNHGALWFHPRRGFGEENNTVRTLISPDAIGRPFDMKVLDDGLNYEMFIDGQSVGTGQWQRTQNIGFRWGIYVGASEVADDIVVLVTGATMK